MSNSIYEKINVEDNNFANIFRMDRNSMYVFFLKISRVKYKHFFELRLYYNCNPVISTKISYRQLVEASAYYIK